MNTIKLNQTSDKERFSRFSKIDWWQQDMLSKSKVLVIGAGALGNEVIKNLSLLGVGNIAIVDMDKIELSNLSRSILYRAEDSGKYKAECAADAAKEIFPKIQAHALVSNVITDVGLGYFYWADIVVGALDNREARVFVNNVCYQLSKPWIDGGIEVLQGIVRGFNPPVTSCYECTMNKVDWDLLNKRRSCTMLAQRALAQSGTPTTPTIASIIGAIQAQEVVKYLHDKDTLLGEGLYFNGDTNQFYNIKYDIKPDCMLHEKHYAVLPTNESGEKTTIQKIWDVAKKHLGGLDALDFSREIVDSIECSSCGFAKQIFNSVTNTKTKDMLCPKCNTLCALVFLHSIDNINNYAEMNYCELGLPEYDIVWARFGSKGIGIGIFGSDVFKIK